MNPIYSLIELRQSHHYYHHFSTLMVLLWLFNISYCYSTNNYFLIFIILQSYLSYPNHCSSFIS
jgi:hypothetical protein